METRPRLEELTVRRTMDDRSYRLWIEPAARGRLCVFLDGEFYLRRMNGPGVIERLRKQGIMMDQRCVFLSYGTMETRLADYTGSPTFSTFLATNLLPQLAGDRADPDGRQHILVGLSLSGLAAAFAAITYPEAFAAAVCQSPSVWWRDEQLRRDLAGLSLPGARFYLSVGAEETEVDEHGPRTEMFQAVSQLDATQNLARTLREAGAEAELTVFNGGHDIGCWEQDLPAALAWAARAS